MTRLLYGLLGKSAPPEPPKLKPITPPPVPLVPVRTEPEPQAPPQPNPEDLATAKCLDELGRIYDSLVERLEHNNELLPIYTTRMFQLSEKENSK